MRYRISVYHKPPELEVLSSHFKAMTGKDLILSKTFEFDTDQPLTEEQVADIKATKEDWMESIEVEEVGLDQRILVDGK